MDTSATSKSASTHHPKLGFELYLVIANISKHHNVRSLLLTAAAFCQGVIIVGIKKFDSEQDLPGPLRVVKDEDLDDNDHDDQNVVDDDGHRSGDDHEQQVDKKTWRRRQRRQLPIIRLDRWDDCVAYLRDRQIQLVGVEIQEHSVLLQEFCNQLLQQRDDHQYPPLDMAVVMGNEGQGLSPKQMACCDTLVRIPQFGNGTASLNVYVAASIILQQLHQIQRRWQEPKTISVADTSQISCNNPIDQEKLEY
jgi:tRNA G18 (ribose-2'-O)-methylase SpoU